MSVNLNIVQWGIPVHRLSQRWVRSSAFDYVNNKSYGSDVIQILRKWDIYIGN